MGLKTGLFAAILSAIPLEPARSQESPSKDDRPSTETAPAPPKQQLLRKTLGGRQFWADVEYFHDWRIQQNVMTSHYRLLDGDDFRHASGDLETCRRRLAELRVSRKLPEMSGEAVILIHGMIRSSKSMRKLQRNLELEDAGFRTFSFDYPSTRVDIERAAEYLHGTIESLHGIERIHFVVHSMGGLVVRAYLARHADPRIGRMVMIATPNSGAELADRFRGNALYRAILGPAGQQLNRDPDGFIAQLPIPEFEFGIIAGGRGTAAGYNPLIPGDDDGTVSVASTRLAGARDFVLLDRLHTFLITAPEARDYTVRFLQEGRFRPDGEPQPIPRERAPGDAQAGETPRVVR
jgi:pimeloyl-ACP methyl ester carboxylesterase